MNIRYNFWVFGKISLHFLVMQMNICKIIYLNCGERYELMIDHRSYTHNLNSCGIKVWEHSVLNGILTHDLCDTGAVLYRLSYQKTFYNIIITEAKGGHFFDRIASNAIKMSWSYVLKPWTEFLITVYPACIFLCCIFYAPAAFK